MDYSRIQQAALDGDKAAQLFMLDRSLVDLEFSHNPNYQIAAVVLQSVLDEKRKTCPARMKFHQLRAVEYFAGLVEDGIPESEAVRLTCEKQGYEPDSLRKLIKTYLG